MNVRTLTSIALTASIMLVGLGLYVPIMIHDGHEMDCPFAPGGTAICAAPLAHLEHWQSAFAIIPIEILVLTAALVFLGAQSPIPTIDQQYERYRLRARTPIRPPLFQELFSGGLLNPKAA